MAAPGEVKCRAVIRVRRGQDPNGVTIRSSNSIQVNGEDGAAVPGAAATVDFVCDPDATQADVYTRVAEPLVHQFVDQTLNVALIVLGAGGSGKTHSLLGGAGSEAGSPFQSAQRSPAPVTSCTCCRALGTTRACACPLASSRVRSCPLGLLSCRLSRLLSARQARLARLSRLSRRPKPAPCAATVAS